MTKSVVIVLGQYSDRPVGDQADPCMFLTKPTRPPRSSNTQGSAWPHLLSEFCALFCFTPLFVIETAYTKEEAEQVGKYMIRTLLSLERLSFAEKEGKVCYQYGKDSFEQVALMAAGLPLWRISCP
jgi:hypothetical protein